MMTNVRENGKMCSFSKSFDTQKLHHLCNILAVGGENPPRNKNTLSVARVICYLDKLMPENSLTMTTV